MKKWSVGAILGLCLVAVAMGLGSPSTVSADNTQYCVTGTFHPNWMKWIPNDTRLTELSLPGTHDSIAYGDDLTLWVLTQNWNLETQLKHGIRVLDIRALHRDDSFKMVHGAVLLGENFDDVLSGVTAFLKNTSKRRC